MFNMQVISKRKIRNIEYNEYIAFDRYKQVILNISTTNQMKHSSRYLIHHGSHITSYHITSHTNHDETFLDPHPLFVLPTFLRKKI